jgi:hypothetical protein
VQVPPVLQVQVVPEQLQSPEQAAKVDGLFPPQLSGRAAPTTTINVTPRDNDHTDCDTFTSLVFKAEGSGAMPTHACATPTRPATHMPAVAARSCLEWREPRKQAWQGQPAAWSRLLPVGFQPSWCAGGRRRAAHGRCFLVFGLCAGLVRAGA